MNDSDASFRRVVAVTGPTATGKTALAVALANQFSGEIVSVDSRQVYRQMDLGTGKDLAEYGDIPYHLIDIADPKTEVYNLHRFCRDAYAAIDDIVRRGKLPILCGGTALYLEALLRGFALPGQALAPRQIGVPRQRQTLDAAPSQPPPFALDALIIGVYFERREVRERIARRLDQRLDAGMIDEVKRLHAAGVSFQQLEFFGLEYREIARLLQGQCDEKEMRRQLLNRIRQFAKRQDIFFRKMEREQLVIHWIRRGEFAAAAALVADFLQNHPLPEPEFRLCDLVNGPSF